MLGGTYGRVVNVIAGKGNNGADGRVAAGLLAAAGVRVRTFDAAACAGHVAAGDLVIDAAYGTGFRGEWTAPAIGDTPVLAVDIPSGVDGLTGAAVPTAFEATATVTFAALKPGLLIGDGKRLAGDHHGGRHRPRRDVRDALIASSGGDVAAWWRPRPVDAHKWTRAVRVVAGSPGMTGAASLASSAAMRAGAGIVWLSIPGDDHRAPTSSRSSAKRYRRSRWSDPLTEELERFGSLVIGPGLGTDEGTASEVRATVAAAPCPAVVDGDGLTALAAQGGGDGATVRGRRAATVLTPHDGEYERLAGESPGPDRFDAVRRLAAATGAIVLLKGPTTLIAEPGGAVRAVTSGDERLATAGSGDVLSGIIGALLAGGMEAFDAAAAAAWLHATAASLRPASGLVASDLSRAIPAAIDAMRP